MWTEVRKSHAIRAMPGGDGGLKPGTRRLRLRRRAPATLPRRMDGPVSFRSRMEGMMPTQDELTLRRNGNRVLGTCSPQTVAAMAQHGSLWSFERGTLLFRRGEPAGQVLFLLDGVLQIAKSEAGGRRQVICTLSPRECGGLCLLMFTERALADVSGIRPGSVLMLEAAEFRRLAMTDASLGEAGWRAAADCMTHLSNLVENLSFHKVAQRVALCLFENTERDGDLVRLTQADLAAEVGSTREVVARCLAALQAAGIIRPGRGRITVLHREQLTEMA